MNSIFSVFIKKSLFNSTTRNLYNNHFIEFRNCKINNCVKKKIMNKKNIEIKNWSPFNNKFCLCGNQKNKCNLNNECLIRNKRED